MKCVNVGCCVQHQLAPTLQNTPSVSVPAGRSGEGPPSLQRRGVSSLKQQNSSADTHRRSLHWHCYLYQHFIMLMLPFLLFKAVNLFNTPSVLAATPMRPLLGQLPLCPTNNTGAIPFRWADSSMRVTSYKWLEYIVTMLLVIKFTHKISHFL